MDLSYIHLYEIESSLWKKNNRNFYAKIKEYIKFHYEINSCAVFAVELKLKTISPLDPFCCLVIDSQFI